MSTLKVDAIRHNSATSDAITTVSDGTCTAKLTSVGGGQLSNRNMVINGAMMIAQRGTSALTWGQGNAYQIDTFRGRNNGGEFSMQQVTDAPSGTGLYNSIKCQVTSADTSKGNTEYNTLVHIVEGYDFQRTSFGTSGAKTCTLSFYVKSNVTGTHTGAFVNVDNNRSLAYNYTINSANTWERKTITIPGDTSGTWNKGNSVGIKIIFPLGIGASFQTANVNTWEATESMGTDDGQNLMASTSNNLYLTGIQLEVGDTATSFAHRSRGEELRRCQRYCVLKGGANGTYDAMATGSVWNSTLAFVPYSLPVEMRTTPSFTLVGAVTDFMYSRGTSEVNPSNLEFDQAGLSMLAVKVTGSSMTAGQATRLYNMNTNGGFLFTAEF